MSLLANTIRPILGVVGAAFLVAVQATVARADIKITSKTTTGKDSVTATTYYKGSKSRMESGKNVILTDSATGKTYVLNPDKKEYSYVNANDASSRQAASVMQMFEVSADVKPGGKTKTLLGKPCKNYIYTVTLRPNATMRARMAEAQKKNPNSGPPPSLFMTVRGEEWVTESLGVSGSAGGSAMRDMLNIPNMRPVMQKFAIIKGISLESNVTFTFGDPKNGGSSNTARTVATAISQETLPDSMFKVPLDYKLVPLIPSGGPRPGGRPGGAPARNGA